MSSQRRVQNVVGPAFRTSRDVASVEVSDGEITLSFSSPDSEAKWLQHW